MSKVTLPAHYDGERIVLDKPYDLPVNASLMVTVLPFPAEVEAEDAWLRAAVSGGAFAFLADPAEDVYTVADGKPFHDAV